MRRQADQRHQQQHTSWYDQSWLAPSNHPMSAPSIAVGTHRTWCGRSLGVMQALTGCRTSCSEIFLIEHGRKLCPRTNWNVADSTPECQTALKSESSLYWRYPGQEAGRAARPKEGRRHRSAQSLGSPAVVKTGGMAEQSVASVLGRDHPSLRRRRILPPLTACATAFLT